MASIAEQLAKLKDRRDELEGIRASLAERLAATTRDLESQQAELDGLDAKKSVADAEVDATKGLESTVRTAAEAVKDVRALAQVELTRAREEHGALAAAAEQELHAEQRTLLSEGIDAIDRAIESATESASEAQERLAAAEEAANDAREREAEAAAAYEEGLRRVQSMPQRVEARSAEVVALRGAAKEAMDAGRTAESFVRQHDLARAIERLEEAVGEPDPDALADELAGLWDAKLSASQEALDASAVVGALREPAAEAPRTRDQLVAGREEAIARLLSEPVPQRAEPVGEDRPDDGGNPPKEGDPPTSEHPADDGDAATEESSGQP
jgi:chromosome segregation ATPase